ncbi:integral membrane protein GPR137C isoform X1 [Lampetra fluviatilis]
MSLWLSMAMLAAPSQPPPPLSSSSSSSSPPQPPSTWARGGDVPGPPAPVGPAVPPSVATALTGLFTGLYGLLFLCVYLQLWLVLRYRYKRFSFQTVFLALCLLWAGLRATLFVFYFENCQAANRLGAFAFWLLYCCPVCLQFFTLCLLNLYFSQMVIRAKSKHAEEQHKNNRVLRGVLLLASLLFLAVNVSCAVLVAGGPSYMVLKRLVLLRVLVNDVLFVACAVGLAICIWQMAKLPATGIYLESKGTSVCQAVTVGTLVILLYATRACYNLVVLAKSAPGSFNYDWYNVSDQADLQELHTNSKFVLFGVVLFVWELLPTGLVVIFFRVRRPNQNLSAAGVLGVRGFASRVHFFDNPRRYDSEDDLTRPLGAHPNGLIGSLSSMCGLYGSPGRYGSIRNSYTRSASPLLVHGRPGFSVSPYTTPQS